MCRSWLIALVVAPTLAHAQEHPHHESHDHDTPLGIPMSRFASGTSWIADDSPTRMLHTTSGAWQLMLHGNVFAGYTEQGTDAGDTALVSQNWIGAVASRRVGRGRLQLRAMGSAEPLTVGDSYPLLLQTGETADGMPLVDRQHPHDLIMEAAASYTHELTDNIAVELYGGVAGEPALGPTAYMHRPASFANPLAPLGHHMQDSTHIAHGVVTAGVFMREAKLEASWFNGREPDEERYDVDLRTPDSYAVRAQFNPHRAWSLSAAYAYLASPEAREPYVSAQRFTYSLTHAMRLGGRRTWTNSAGVGQNFPYEGRMTHSVLWESALDLDRAGTTWFRFEEMGKSGHDFALADEMEHADVLFGTLTVGHVHPVLRTRDVETAVGVLGTLGYVDAVIVPRYGTHWPVGAMAFVQVVPRAR